MGLISRVSSRTYRKIKTLTKNQLTMASFASLDIRFKVRPAIELVTELKESAISDYINNNINETYIADEMLVYLMYIRDMARYDENYKKIYKELKVEQQIENIELAKKC